jgi:hypothetical protein
LPLHALAHCLEKTTSRPPFVHTGVGKTLALLMEMCERITAKGMVVILDSGFCVLEGLATLRRMGVYASAVIKKRKYWPKHAPGDAMDEYMNNPEHNKKVGDTAALKVSVQLILYEGCRQQLKLISTYGVLVSAPSALDKQRTIPDGTKVSIKYTMPSKITIFTGTLLTITTICASRTSP